MPNAPPRAAGGSPARIGRFDLASGELLPPFDAPGLGEVWDVLALDERVYFARFFGAPGWVRRDGKGAKTWDHLGTGTVELAPGPDASLLFADYANARVLVVNRDGELLASHALIDPGGPRVAPKSVAYDPVEQEIWAIADRIAGDGSVTLRDAWVLDRRGSVRRHVIDREVQFAAFSATGAGAIAEIRDTGLWLRLRLPGERFRSIQLDNAFPAALDFAQDIAFGEPGDEVLGVVQRWSGIYHAFSRRGAVETGRLPAGDGGLYYTGISAGGRVCGTLCRKEPAILCEEPLR